MENEIAKAQHMETARVTTSELGQTVQLPDGFQIDANEIYVKRVGRSVLLIPKDADPWGSLAESLEQVTGDFMEDRAQPAEQYREAMFE